MIRNKSFENNKPLIYLIATPIGNLGEMSKRALDVIQEMDVIAAEVRLYGRVQSFLQILPKKCPYLFQK